MLQRRAPEADVAVVEVDVVVALRLLMFRRQRVR
jgi:hypothetical protein